MCISRKVRCLPYKINTNLANVNLLERKRNPKEHWKNPVGCCKISEWMNKFYFLFYGNKNISKESKIKQVMFLSESWFSNRISTTCRISFLQITPLIEFLQILVYSVKYISIHNYFRWNDYFKDKNLTCPVR